MSFRMDLVSTPKFSVPEFCKSQWLLRLPLALIIIQQATWKFPLTADDAASFGLPMTLWMIGAFGELFAGLALFSGGLIRSWYGDLLTRLGGLGLAVIIVSVLIIAHKAPIIDILLYNQFHLLLLLGGLFFGLRGNKAK